MNSLRIVTLSLLCGLGLVLAGCQTTGKDVATGGVVMPQPGEAVTLSQVIVVADASGSMFPDNKFPFEKEVVRAFTSTMPEGHYDAGIMSFGNEWPQDWVDLPPAPFNRERVQLGASHLKWLGGSTPLPDALASLAPDLMGYPGRTAVVILSDGQADREATLDVCTKLMGIHAGPICFHTVHFGPENEGALTLEAIAALTTCGSARCGEDVTSVEGMEAFIRDVFFGPAGDASGQGMVILFGSDKSYIRPGYMPIVDKAAKLLMDNPSMKLKVTGYTDSTATESYNMGLSQRRANAVADALVSKGISRDRLVLDAHGEMHPAAPNTSAERRALNRRVELTVIM